MIHIKLVIIRTLNYIRAVFVPSKFGKLLEEGLTPRSRPLSRPSVLGAHPGVEGTGIYNQGVSHVHQNPKRTCIKLIK